MPEIDLNKIVTEKQLEAQVKQLAKLGGWEHYHTYNSIHSEKGFPDDVMVKGNRLLFAELKRQYGKVTREQQHWLDILASIPAVEVYLWRPGDYEEIRKVLLGEKID